MKKYIIVVVVLALIITTGIAEQKYLTKTLDKFEAKIEIVAAKAKDKSVVKADADELNKWWLDNKDGLDFIVPHINITEADMRLGEMTALVEGKKYEEAYAQLMILKSLSMRIKELLSK